MFPVYLENYYSLLPQLSNSHIIVVSPFTYMNFYDSHFVIASLEFLLEGPIQGRYKFKEKAERKFQEKVNC